jgi:LCP family protein required for cell wall assembly
MPSPPPQAEGPAPTDHAPDPIVESDASREADGSTAATPRTIQTAPAADPLGVSDRPAIIAAVLSFVFPGAGQLYLGRRVWATVFALPSLLVLAWAALQLDRGFVYFALSMLDDSYALTVMAVAAAFTAWRLASIVHPFLLVRRRPTGARTIAALAILAIATVGMGDVVFSNAYDAFSASRQIASNDFADPTPGPTAAPTAAQEPSASSTPTDYAAQTESAQPSESATPEPTPTIDPCATPIAARQVVPFVGSLSAAVAAGGGSSLSSDHTPVPTPTNALAPANPTPTVLSTPTHTPAPTPTPSPTPGPTLSPSPSPDVSSHRLTVLLTGVDFITGRHHALNDTLMLVSVNLQTRDVAMVSVPRDTAAFPFYWGGQAPVNFKINSLVNAISAGRFGSPDSPMVTLANEVGYLVGIKVDYYAEIDMAGFSKMIDVVGGVDVNNPTVLDDPSTCTYIPAGPVHLNGWLALKYVRSRETSNDYARASRQQLVMMALEKKIATPANLPKLGSLLALAGSSIATNFPLKTAKDYVDIAESVNSTARCVLGPPYNYHPDSSTTGGTWTSRLRLDQVAGLSVQLFGADSRYFGQPGVAPAPCRN